MKKSTKVWLIVAGCLVLAGAIIAAISIATNNREFSSIVAAENETRTFEIDEEFSDINLVSSTEDITISTSQDGKCKVVFDVPQRYEVKVAVEEGTLDIRTHNTYGLKQLIDNFTFGIDGRTAITVYLPALRYDSLAISESTGEIDIEGLRTGGLRIVDTTGDVRVNNCQCGEVSVDTSTGDVELVGVTGDVLSSRGTTGDTTMRRVVIGDRLAVERGTGNVIMDGCDAGEIEISTSTGDVKGTLFSDKEFVVKTSTGDIEVPESTGGAGRCTITTSTGDIKIKIEK